MSDKPKGLATTITSPANYASPMNREEGGAENDGSGLDRGVSNSAGKARIGSRLASAAGVAGKKAIDGGVGLGKAAFEGVKNAVDAAKVSVGKIGSAFMATSAKVGAFVGVSTATAAVASVVACVGVAGAAGYIAYDSITNHDYEMKYVGLIDEDCTVGIKQAVNITGMGENQIPEPYGSYMTYSAMGPDGYWYFSDSASDKRGIARASGLGPIYYDVWQKQSSKDQYDDQGFAMINGKYLVATTEKYGETGDHVTFYLDDNTGIDCILFDSKNASDAGRNEWGHGGGENVLEFELKPKDLGGPGTNPGHPGAHPEWGGHRTSSWTNHGIDVDVKKGLGMDGSVVDGSDKSQNNGRSNSLKSARDNCKRDCESKVNASSIAEAAVTFAYSRQVHDYEGYLGTELWLKVFNAVLPGDENSRSCDRTVCTAVRWAGADDSYPAGPCTAQLAYCISNSGKWESVGRYTGDNSILKPGDVLIAEHHTVMYVGEDAVKGHKFTGDADVGPVADGADLVSGSLSDRAPGVGNVEYEANGYSVFRCKQYEKDSKYKNAVQGISLSSTGVASACGDVDAGTVLCVGDSIMAMMNPELEKAISDVTIDAIAGRSYDGSSVDNAEDIGTLKTVEKMAPGFGTVVIALGNNDASGLDEGQVQALVNACDSKSKVWLIKPQVERSQKTINKTCASIDAVASKNNNVGVINWNSVAKSHPEYLMDGCHPTSPDGVNAYVKCITDAIGAKGSK